MPSQSIHIPRDLYLELIKIAETEKKSFSKVVVELIQEALEHRSRGVSK